MRAIDIHTHVPERPGGASNATQSQMDRYFGESNRGTIEQMAAMYEELDIFAVIFGVDSETTSGQPYAGNDYTASIVQKYPQRFMGFASVDPHKGKAAVIEIERSVKELGLRGLKLHPISQAFFPNDTRFYPLWEKCAELGVPVLFHTGQTAVGAGLPGGGGLKIKYAQPIHIDDVAADFPALNIIMAHPGVPWQEEQLSIALHKPNVYIDLSGWSPKYFRPIMVQYANSLLQNKVLFGSDFPALTPERWLRDFEALDLKPEVREKILLENAKKLLRLE
ncbi:MAG TPA: amidohydrolase family protein [Dehalococcoidia bacterium]|nr:amidohydrolase family protein [Dehalococcoidia bacterium]